MLHDLETLVVSGDSAPSQIVRRIESKPPPPPRPPEAFFFWCSASAARTARGGGLGVVWMFRRLRKVVPLGMAGGCSVTASAASGSLGLNLALEPEREEKFSLSFPPDTIF